jgi:AcrR family transcriptional regulator
MAPDASPAEATRRERKKRRTREAIESAALDLFERQGFKETTIAQIAEAADVACSTVFLHFPTKEDLIFAGHRVEAEALITLLEEEGRPTVDVLRDYLPAVDRRKPETNIWVRRLAVINADAALRQEERSRWADLVHPALTSSYARELGEAPPFLEARMLAAITVAGLVELGRLEAEGRSPKHMADRLLAHLARLVDATAASGSSPRRTGP